MALRACGFFFSLIRPDNHICICGGVSYGSKVSFIGTLADWLRDWNWVFLACLALVVPFFLNNTNLCLVFLKINNF